MLWPAPFHPSFCLAWFPSSSAHRKPSEVQLLSCNSKFQEEILIGIASVTCEVLSNQQWQRKDCTANHKHGYKYEQGQRHRGAVIPEGSKNVGTEQFFITYLYLMSGSQVKFIQNIPFQPPWFLSWIIVIAKAKDRMWLMSKYRNKQNNWRALWRFSLKGNHFLT